MENDRLARLGPRPSFERGDCVVIEEPGISNWRGRVASVKPGATTWYVELRADETGMTWSVPASLVSRAEER